MPKFTTLVPHIGDRPYEPYQPGETREVDDENIIKHLIDGGTLGAYDAKAEAEFNSKSEGKAPANKAEGKAPSNKAA
ncbi:hypothetical protein [Sphingomonas sp. MMS24-J13]|uniref:hypothetical protein n=1 Tax=Sphingomonas sp. MMS24-J13 TaxID=3238686 RepID=UPI00384F03FA